MSGLDIKGLNATAVTEFAMQESKNASSTLLQNKIQSTSKDSTDEELWAACKGFEAYFLEQMYKEMQKSVDALKPDSNDKSTDTLVSFFKDQTLQDPRRAVGRSPMESKKGWRISPTSGRTRSPAR